MTGPAVGPAGAADGLMQPSTAAQLGLVEAWRRQMPVLGGASSIVDQQIRIHPDVPHEYVEVVAAGAAEKSAAPQDAKQGGQPENQQSASDEAAGGNGQNASSGDKAAEPTVFVRLATDQRDISGNPIGKPEAERQARNAVRKLKRRGVETEITSRTVPAVRLYTLGDDGTVECRDAETGRSIWLNRVGDRTRGYGRMGVGDEYLTLINGSNLLKLNVTNGRLIEEASTQGVPQFGSVHAGNYAVVPTVNSGIEGYPLDNITEYPFQETVYGTALTMPTKSADSNHLAWGTDEAMVYVMDVEGTPNVQFRLDTDGIVSGRIATAPGKRFCFGSEAGQVYCVKATRTGTVLWNKPFGEPFYHGPVVVGDQVLLRSTYGNLFSLDLDSGVSTWDNSVAGIDELIAVIDNQLFVRTLSGALRILDLDTGQSPTTLYQIQPEHLLVNRETNRLYLLTDTGTVQCLRPEKSPLPEVYQQTQTPPAAEQEQPAKPEQAEKPDDPFAEGAADGAPFGGDDAGGDGAPDDPFGGGGDDPFGGESPF